MVYWPCVELFPPHTHTLHWPRHGTDLLSTVFSVCDTSSTAMQALWVLPSITDTQGYLKVTSRSHSSFRNSVLKPMATSGSPLPHPSVFPVCQCRWLLWSWNFLCRKGTVLKPALTTSTSMMTIEMVSDQPCWLLPEWVHAPVFKSFLAMDSNESQMSLQCYQQPA